MTRRRIWRLHSMMNYRPSIRLKIRFGYYALVAMMIGASFVTFEELRYLEKKILFGDVISEFFDTTLEIRRFEKNYFLYEQHSDYEENLGYVNKAQELLENNQVGFIDIAAPEQLTGLMDGLGNYKNLMERYEKQNAANRSQKFGYDSQIKIKLEGSIRKTGKDIITIAEDISKAERTSLQKLLNNARRVLIISIALLAGLMISAGQALAQMIVKPLKLMEKSMETIADGSFEIIRIASKDREVISLTKAFNKMLKELEMRQRHLVQSEKLASLGTLLSGVAHELNNPLSNISTSGQILLEEIEHDDIEQKKELLAQINDQTDRARNIVRSLLEFSRHKDFKKDRLPLKNVIEEAIRFVKGQVPTGVEITLDVPDNAVIIADKQRIQQVFLNLIRNAIESFPDNKGTIAIKAEKRRAIEDVEDERIGIYNYMNYRGKCALEDDTVDIEIKDSGAGIPLDVLPKIFDPFFTTKEVGRGAGLGLSIVHEIIEEHDGCIAVDSTPGRGTTFLIRLPIKE